MTRARCSWDRTADVRISGVLDADIAQQFLDDAGAAHSPARTRDQRARVRPVLVVAPACPSGIYSGTCGEIVHQDLGEPQPVGALDLAVAGQAEDPGGSAAVSAVVPESWPGPDGTTTSNCPCRPRSAEQAKQ
jgi:hypothetical protein